MADCQGPLTHDRGLHFHRHGGDERGGGHVLVGLPRRLLGCGPKLALEVGIDYEGFEIILHRVTGWSATDGGLLGKNTGGGSVVVASDGRNHFARLLGVTCGTGGVELVYTRPTPPGNSRRTPSKHWSRASCWPTTVLSTCDACDRLCVAHQSQPRWYASTLVFSQHPLEDVYSVLVLWRVHSITFAE